MPVQIGRPVRPPNGTALAEFSFGDVDRVMCSGFGSEVLRELGRPDGAARYHQFAYKCGPYRRRQTRIGQPPKPVADDEISPVWRHGMLEADHQMNGLPPVTAIVVPDT